MGNKTLTEHDLIRQ